MTNELQVPELPSEWSLPFTYGTIETHHSVGMECVHDNINKCMVFDCGHQTGKFLAALINAVYTPDGLLARLKKAEQKFNEIERQHDDEVDDHVWKGE